MKKDQVPGTWRKLYTDQIYNPLFVPILFGSSNYNARYELGISHAWGVRKLTQAFARKIWQKRGHFEDLNLNGKTILKSILKIWRDGVDWIYLAQNKY
jgi:hypothetical protein